MKTTKRVLRPPSAALLIIDMISDFKFEDGVAIARAALPAARQTATLCGLATAKRVPMLFVNDNLGHWRIAAKTSRRKQFALEYFNTTLHADTRPSSRLNFAAKS
jgi:nicotinamidase-related amidase